MINGTLTGIHARYSAIVNSIAGLVLMLLLTACGSTPTSVSGKGATQTEFNQTGYEVALKLMEQKKYSDAVFAFEKIIRDSGKRAGPFINLGIAYRQLGKFDDSKKALLTATKYNSRSAPAFNELGLTHRKLGEFASAKKAYLKSIDNKSRYSLPYRNLGILCDIYLQDLSCAIRNYRKYQSLTGSEDKKVDLWIVDLKTRMSRKAKGK